MSDLEPDRERPLRVGVSSCLLGSEVRFDGGHKRDRFLTEHAAGHLKSKLDSASRTELADLIHDYRRGRVPLVVPLTLIGHYVRCHDVDSLKGQLFLEPHPKELMLRNHV